VDVGLVLGGLVVGFIVGLTGMGGGALMTPMLVFFFGVNPLAAVSSDLVTSAIMKPFGAAVHLQHGTVNRALVGWLVLGSVPSAFLGVLVLRALGRDTGIEEVVKTALGVALLVAAFALIAKAYVTMAGRVRRRAKGVTEVASARGALNLVARPLPTILIGVVGGLVVGMTSVGSGSLMIIALMLVYPRLQASQLVGTDLVQAVPLSLLVGSIPGVLLGAIASSRAPGGLIRRALALVLLASGLKLLGVTTSVTAVILVVSLVLGPLAWMGARRRNGLPALRRAAA
jgi:uncharacterized membrane protein YfcA